jgi:hypothetical protein
MPFRFTHPQNHDLSSQIKQKEKGFILLKEEEKVKGENYQFTASFFSPLCHFLLFPRFSFLPCSSTFNNNFAFSKTAFGLGRLVGERINNKKRKHLTLNKLFI